MTLAIGTALQKGNYVIDALGSEDSIGPVYLATHVPSGQWAMVRVLGSRHPEAMPTPEQRSAFYQYLVEVSDLGHGLLPNRLRGFEEDGVCYQALSMPKGESLAAIVSPQQSLSLAHSLAIIRSLGDVLQALQPHGWSGLHITPDQVWQWPDGQHLTFTGFNLPASPELDHPTAETTVVQALTHLLYFLLTGQRADATQTPIVIDLHHRRPGLSAQVDGALQRGSLAMSNPIALADWLALLPAADPASVTVSGAPTMAKPQLSVASSSAMPQASISSSSSSSDKPESTVVVSPAQPRSSAHAVTQAKAITTKPHQPRKSSGLAPWALLTTGLAAGLSGLVFGFYVRLQPVPVDASSNSTNSTRFNPNQSFPPLPDWQGQDFLPSNTNRSPRERRPDYGDSPAQTAPVQRSLPATAPVVRDAPIADPAPPPRSEPAISEPANPDPGPSETVPPAPADSLAPPESRPSNPAPSEPPAAPPAPAPMAPAPPLEVAPPVAPAPPPPLAPPPIVDPPAPLTSS